MWTAEYRAQSLPRRTVAQGAASLAQDAANLGTRLSTRLAKTVAPQTTRWGAQAMQRLGRNDTLQPPAKVTTPKSVAELAAEGADVSSSMHAVWTTLLEAAPPLSEALVERLLRRLGGAPDPPDPAHALCELLLTKLTNVEMPEMDATLLRLLAYGLVRDRRGPGPAASEARRKYATVLWDYTELYAPAARRAALHAPTTVVPRRSKWRTRRGDPGFLEEATQRLSQHLIQVFGTAKPSLSCPDKRGPLKLTPPQEVVRYLYDPETGPATKRFLVVLRPGFGKTLCMLVALAAHWKAYEAARKLDPKLSPPPFLVLALPPVQANLSAELKLFAGQLGIEAMPEPVMIDFRYANAANLDTIRRIGRNPRGCILVDEATDLVELSLDKQRNSGGASRPQARANGILIARMLETELHADLALMLLTGTPALDELVRVVKGGAPHTEGTVIECMALRNTDVFPRLDPGIGMVPGEAGAAGVGDYEPFTEQNVVRVPLDAEQSFDDDPEVDELAAFIQQLNVEDAGTAEQSPDDAPDDVETLYKGSSKATKKTAATAQPPRTYLDALKAEAKANNPQPHKYLPEAKFAERGNCTASYLGFLVSNYSPEFQKAVTTYPFHMVPKLAACAAAVLKMHFESYIFDPARGSTRLLSVDRTDGSDLVLLRFETGGRIHATVRTAEAKAPSTASVVLKAGGDAFLPPAAPSPPAAWLRIEGVTDPFFVTNAPSAPAWPRQLIMLDKKHGLRLFPKVLKVVAKRLYPSRTVDVDKSLFVLEDAKQIPAMQSAFDKGTTPWLIVDAALFSESIDLPGPQLNPVALQHYVSLPVDSKGEGNANKFVQGMLRTARLCKSRPRWTVRLVLYRLVGTTGVAACDATALEGMRKHTDEYYGPDGPFQRARSLAIDAEVMRHINDGTAAEAEAAEAAAPPEPWLRGMDLTWIEEVVNQCLAQDAARDTKPCVDFGASECPAPLCRVEAGRCVSRPEGSVCDALAAELQRFEAWANNLTDGVVAALRTPAEDAVRTLVTTGAFAGADADSGGGGASSSSETLRLVRKVSGNLLRLANLGRYQPYFDAASVNAAARVQIQGLVAAAAQGLGVAEDAIEARTLGCAVLLSEWMRRSDFHFGKRFRQKMLPALAAVIGDQLFRLGTPRYGLQGLAWYDGVFSRFLAQTQTAVQEHAGQAARHVGFAKDAVKDGARRLYNVARRMLSLPEIDPAADPLDWASSPHSLFVMLLLQRMAA